MADQKIKATCLSGHPVQKAKISKSLDRTHPCLLKKQDVSIKLTGDARDPLLVVKSSARRPVFFTGNTKWLSQSVLIFLILKQGIKYGLRGVFPFTS